MGPFWCPPNRGVNWCDGLLGEGGTGIPNQNLPRRLSVEPEEKSPALKKYGDSIEYETYPNLCALKKGEGGGKWDTAAFCTYLIRDKEFIVSAKKKHTAKRSKHNISIRK